VKKATTIGFWLLVSVAAAQGPMRLGTNSLYNPQAANPGFLRRTAMKKGDILTIRVNEVVKGQFKASTTATKTTSANVNKINLPILDVFAGPVLGNILGSQAGTPQRLINGLLGGGSTGGSYSNAGGGTADQSSNLNAAMSVIVTEVDEAGNLHVEGHRDIRVNKETQRLTLRGIVRADDVNPDNTVASEKIANAEISADGKGAVVEKTRRGILGKIQDWLF